MQVKTVQFRVYKELSTQGCKEEAGSYGMLTYRTMATAAAGFAHRLR